MLQSMQSIDILEVQDKIGKENRIKDKQSQLLTTLKIDSPDIKKLQLKLRTAEGQMGNLNAFIIERASGPGQ